MDQETQILLFSRKVSKAFGVSYEDVVTAAEIGMKWDLGEYQVEALTRDFPTGRHAFLQVSPPVQYSPYYLNFCVICGDMLLPNHPTQEDILRRIQEELSEDIQQECERETVVMGEDELNDLFERVKREDI